MISVFCQAIRSVSSLKILTKITCISTALTMLLVLTVFSACGRNSTSAPPGSTTSLAGTSNTPITSSLSPTASGDIFSVIPYFPIQKEPAIVGLDGGTSGKLELVNGHLRVEHTIGEIKVSEFIIWPYSYYLSTYGNRIQVLDEKGQPRFRVGDIVQIGGGQISADFAEEKMGKALPDDIEGPYWIAGGTTLAPYLPTQLPDYQPQYSLNSSAAGLLVIEDDLVRLKTREGDSLLAIWPSGYSLEFEGQEYKVYNDRNQLVAGAGSKKYYGGDLISLAGGEVSAGDAAKFIGLPAVPQSWEGPYWLVTKVED